jgi:hypothetical protein
MLDIDHYLLEEDSLRGLGMAEDPAKVVSDMRSGIYRDLYGQGRSNDMPTDEMLMEDQPTMQAARPIKPYIPPTELTEDAMLPYGNVVDAPLG